MSKEKLTLLKTKDSLPKWFPLPVYSKSLSDNQWLDEITMRMSLKTVLENTGNKQKVIKNFKSIIVKQNYIKESLASKSKKLGRIFGIRELTSFDAAYLCCAIESNNTGQSLKKALKEIRASDNLRHLFDEDKIDISNKKHISFGELIDWKNEPIPLPEVLTGFPIVVDLDYDDESLKLMFSIWLAGVRDELGKTKKPITDIYLKQLKEFGVLQTFDLQFWAKLNNSKYTNNIIANAIWPDSDVDTTERLRKVTIPKVNDVFNDWDFFHRLIKQLEMSNAIDNMINGMKK